MTNPPGIVPERVMVFIDAMNLYESLGRKGVNINTNIDFHKLACKLACPHRRLIRVHVYTGTYDQTREPAKYAAQMRFFSRVQHMPFVTLRSRPLLSRRGGYVQKGVDTLIATDMVSMAFLNHYDLAILVSGDGDLAPAVDAVKAAGKQIIAAMFTRSRSNAVASSADQEVRLDAAFFTDCY
ncbi:MAG: NYN domain-containing protein [Desulfobaccales bacterium]